MAYGIGTALESSVTLFGNTVSLTKAWYIAGKLLGGYPLAQGSAYFLASRKTADRLTWITLPFIAVGGILPGIGGTLAKTGVIEALYIGEFAGLILIWIGFVTNVKAPRPASPQPTMTH